MLKERDENVAETQIYLNSKITQDKDTETFIKEATGQVNETNDAIRLSYAEDETIPVKVLIKADRVIIRRGVDNNNFSLMKFTPGEKEECHYVVEGRRMDMTSVTNLLELQEQDNGSRKLRLEYDLFNGLYLIGNYAVTLIFT